MAKGERKGWKRDKKVGSEIKTNKQVDPLRKTKKKKAEKRRRRTKKRQAQQLPSLQELCEALPKVQEQEENKLSFTKAKTRTQLVALESARLRGVHSSSTFQEDPLQAARNHLESTLPEPVMREGMQKNSKEKSKAKRKKKKAVSAEERMKVIMEHEASRMR